jgi:Leucine-rich repeat (LRR) protein
MATIQHNAASAVYITIIMAIIVTLLPVSDVFTTNCNCKSCRSVTATAITATATVTGAASSDSVQATHTTAEADSVQVLYEIDWLVERSVEHTFKIWLRRHMQEVISTEQGFMDAELTSTLHTADSQLLQSVLPSTTTPKATATATLSTNTNPSRTRDSMVQLTTTFYVKSMVHLETYLATVGPDRKSNIMLLCGQTFGTTVSATSRIRNSNVIGQQSWLTVEAQQQTLHENKLKGIVPGPGAAVSKHHVPDLLGSSVKSNDRSRSRPSQPLASHKIHYYHDHGTHEARLREANALLSQEDCIARWPVSLDDPANRLSIFLGLNRTWQSNNFHEPIHLNHSVSMCCSVSSYRVSITCNSSRNTSGDAVTIVQDLQILFPDGAHTTTISSYLLSNLIQLQSLDLRHNRLASVPESISQLTQLETLDLASNQFSSLSDSIFTLTKLRQLYVQSNQLSSLPASIAHLTELRELYVDSNQLSYLPETISRLQKLQYLGASVNQLSFMPESIAQLTQLRSLDLSSNQLSHLPQSLSHLVHLQELYLNFNQLSSIPKSISQLVQLQKLYVNSNKLFTLPASISQLTQLQVLNGRRNQLSSLPDSFSQLTQLHTLEMSSNQLSSLPESLSQLAQLKHLYIRSNQLSALPISISQLSKLQELDAGSNQLQSLPELVTQLTQLQQLYVDFNQLSSLPESTGQLTQLQVLNMAHNRFVSLPESVSRMSQLQVLDVSSNQLQSLPDSISQLTQLQQLRVGMNQLSSLPTSIAHLTQLLKLDVSSNQLQSLPDSMSQLMQLQQLNVSSNQLAVLPEVTAQLTLLQVLDLSRNKLSLLPDSMAQLTRLQELYADHNQLASLPEWISQLDQLIILTMRWNKLTYLPASIASLAKLQILYVGSNNLSSLPDSVSQLSQLRFLNLSSNQLSSLPESFSMLTQLQKLYVDNNFFSALPAFVSQLEQLQVLEAGSNSIGSLPSSFANLKHLSRLGVQKNRLTYLPVDTLPTTSLQSLDVSQNLIRHLDSSIENASKLVFLNASHNQIESSFNWTAMNLNVLDMTNNSLETVPTANMLSGQPRFVYLAHNRLQDMILRMPAASTDVTGLHPRLRVLDLSFNKFGESDIACANCKRQPSSWHDLANALQHSNAELLNLTGNPGLYFGFRDSVPLCDADEAGSKTPSPAQTSCFTYGPEISTDAQSSANVAENVVVCESLYYVGSQAWGISAEFESTGTTPPSTSVRIDADPSIVAYDSCTLPAFAYPVFSQPQQLILSVPTSSPSASRRKQLTIPREWFGKSELAIPVAAPRCPDIGFEKNACGVYGADDANGASRTSINNWHCGLDGHDPRSYMCSRCFKEDGYIKDGARCRECSSSSAWVIPVLLIGGLFAYVVYIARFADATSYLSSTVLYHMQMVAFLSRGPVGWSKFVRDYFFSWVHASNVDTTSLGCLWPGASQSYQHTLVGSLCVPLVLCVIFTAVCGVLQSIKRWRTTQAVRAHNDWAVLMHEAVPENCTDYSNHHVTDPAAVGINGPDASFDKRHMSSPHQFSVHHLWWKLNLYALYILYAPLTLRIAQAFGSYTSTGQASEFLSARLAVDLEVEYGGSHWQQSILPLALLGGVVYVIGIPVLLFVAVHGHIGGVAASAGSFLTRVFQRNARLLHGAVSQSTLALWLLCSKGVLSILVGLTSHSSVVPMLFVVVLLLLMLVLVTRSSPFMHHDDNVRSYFSFSVLIATYAGAALLTDESSENVTASQHLALSWILVLGNAAALGWMLWTYLRKRYQRNSSVPIVHTVVS